MNKKLVSITALLASLALLGAGCQSSTDSSVKSPPQAVNEDSPEQINRDLQDIQVEGSLEGEFKDMDKDADTL